MTNGNGFMYDYINECHSTCVKVKYSSVLNITRPTLYFDLLTFWNDNGQKDNMPISEPIIMRAHLEC